MSMMSRLTSLSQPHLLILNYTENRICSLFVVPNHFFIPEIIEKRPPLKPSARRSGWEGCNILIDKIPDAGRVHIIQNSVVLPLEKVIKDFNRASFLNNEKYETKGWLLDIMHYIDLNIDLIKKKEFTLEELYAFENQLKLSHPQNNHIRDKIRQQLQYLRDKKYLRFNGYGRYE